MKDLLYAPLRLAAGIYGRAIALRNNFYDKGMLRTYHSRLPVVSIGNVTAGGNGKTPLVIALVQELRKRGYTPAVLSRGYGGSRRGPYEVMLSDDPDEVGDEPLLIKSEAECPVIIARRRVAGAKLIERQKSGDIIILDDGLQHRALGRDVNIVCIRAGDDETVKEFLKGALLPLGRFREQRSRALERADAAVLVERSTVRSGPEHIERLAAVLPPDLAVFRSYLEPRGVFNLTSGHELPPRGVVALSGIAYPQGFHQSLEALGYSLTGREVFQDHHRFTAVEIEQISRRYPGIPVVCTDKDGVKLRRFGLTELFVLRVAARVTPLDAFIVHIERKIRESRRTLS